MDHSDVQVWIAKYTDAWRSPGTAKLSGLFTGDASYRFSPWKPPLRGLRELEPFWERGRDGYDEVFELDYEIVAVEGMTAVVRLEVMYENATPRHWRDLWIIEFDQNYLCRSFEEWPFSPNQFDGHESSTFEGLRS